MKILIVEDELPIAEDIQLIVKDVMKAEAPVIHIETSLRNAMAYITEKQIDVLLLDLNLNSKDGFELLKQAVSKSFHTIVISANINRAIEAFEYGVLDFIPKPYNAERIEAAFSRIKSNHAPDGRAIKYLSVKKGSEIKIIPLEEVQYFKAANVYVELHLKNGKVYIHDKPMKLLVPLLPPSYFRIHKSFIIELNNIDKIHTLGGGHYNVELKSGDIIPISRQKIAELREILGLH